MASLAFQERFKGRSALISNYGAVIINPSNSVTKAKSEQLHPNTLKFTGNSIINSNFATPVKYLKNSETSSDSSSYKARSEIIEPLNSITKRSANHSLIQKNSSKKIFKSVNKSFSICDYKPYTLKDYQNIRPKKYYQLGGLGPVNVGTKDWIKKKDLIEKRWRYGKEVHELNIAKLSDFSNKSPVKVIKNENMSKALEFAKKVVKLPLKQVAEEEVNN